MAIDPVCRMIVSEEVTVFKTEYRRKGSEAPKTYYFCGLGCKERFEKDPEKYLSGQKQDWIRG